MRWFGRICLFTVFPVIAGCVAVGALVSPAFEEEKLSHAGRYEELVGLYESRYPEGERRVRLAAARMHQLSGVVDATLYEYFLRWYPLALLETGQLDRARVELARSRREAESLTQAYAALYRGASSSMHRSTHAYLQRVQRYLDWFQHGTTSANGDPRADPNVITLRPAERLFFVIERAFFEDKILGDAHKALTYLDHGLELAERLDDLTDIDVKLAYTIQAFRRKAWIYMRLGRLGEAKETLDRYEKVTGNVLIRLGKGVLDRTEYFRGYLSVMNSTAGAVYAVSRDFDTAERYFRAARETLKGIPPGSTHAWDRNALASYHVFYGAYVLGPTGDYDAASKEVDEGLRYLRPAYIDALSVEIDIESAYLLSAQLHFRAGRLERARVRAEEARTYAARYRSTPTVMAADGLLGALLVVQNRPRDALIYLERAAGSAQAVESSENWAIYHWLGRAYTMLKRDEAAITQHMKAVDEVEKLWDGRFGDARRQVAFMDDRFVAYEAAIEALVDRGKFEDAFWVVERSKARTAYEARAAETDAGGASDAAKKTRLTGAPLHYSAVKAMLPADVALLEYYVGTRSVVAFAINRRNPLVGKRLPVSPERLREQVHNFTTLIRGGPPSRVVQLGQELYSVLVQPFEASIAVPVLGIVPHGPLHALPFHALTTDVAKEPSKGPRGDAPTSSSNRRPYLIERQAVFYAPSATLLAFSKGREQHARTSILVLASPPVADAADFGEGNPLIKLAHAEEEGHRVAKLYQRATVLTDAAATESSAKRGIETHSNVLFAAHALVAGDEPLRSAVFLARDKQNDGRYSVREIEAQSIPASLVFLSSCSTGEVADHSRPGRRQVLEYSLGDDLVSINRAFLKAGASSVVSTLWLVNDASANEQVVRFFQHYVNGVPRAQALRATSLEWIAKHGDEELGRPRHWAAFFLTGDWR